MDQGWWAIRTPPVPPCLHVPPEIRQHAQTIRRQEEGSAGPGLTLPVAFLCSCITLQRLCSPGCETGLIGLALPTCQVVSRMIRDNESARVYKGYHTHVGGYLVSLQMSSGGQRHQDRLEFQ